MQNYNQFEVKTRKFHMYTYNFPFQKCTVSNMDMQSTKRRKICHFCSFVHVFFKQTFPLNITQATIIWFIIIEMLYLKKKGFSRSFFFTLKVCQLGWIYFAHCNQRYNCADHAHHAHGENRLTLWQYAGMDSKCAIDITEMDGFCLFTKSHLRQKCGFIDSKYLHSFLPLGPQSLLNMKKVLPNLKQRDV